MAQVSSSGVASGLDINLIVKQLVAIERKPIDAAQRKQVAIAAKLTTFASLSATFTSLKSTLTPLASYKSFQVKSASSSDNLVATALVTDSLSAVSGSSTVSQIVSLAQAQKLGSRPFTSPTADVGTGTLKIQAGGGAEKSIIIDSANSNLTQIRDKINSADAGVTASIFKTTDKQYKLVLQSTQSGTENTLQVNVTDGDTNHLDTDGLSQLRYTPTSSSPDNVTHLTETQSAKNAQFVLDGETLTRSSNTITDAIAGVTLTLLKKTAVEAEVSINITSNTAPIKRDIEAFVTAYNEVMKNLNSTQTLDQATQRGGSLFGNTSIQTITKNFRFLPKGNVPDLEGLFRNLADLGIMSQQDGTLKIDGSKLDIALAKDPLAVGRVFASFDKTVDPLAVIPTSGIAVQLSKAITALLDGQSGRLPSEQRGLQEASATIDKEVLRLEARVAGFEKRTRGKFSKLEALLSRIQGVASAFDRQVRQLENVTSFVQRRSNSGGGSSNGG